MRSTLLETGPCGGRLRVIQVHSVTQRLKPRLRPTSAQRRNRVRNALLGELTGGHSDHPEIERVTRTSPSRFVSYTSSIFISASAIGLNHGKSSGTPSGSGDLKSPQMKAPASLSGSSTGIAITERPLVVHSAMKRATRVAGGQSQSSAHRP